MSTQATLFVGEIASVAGGSIAITGERGFTSLSVILSSRRISFRGSAWVNEILRELRMTRGKSAMREGTSV